MIDRLAACEYDLQGPMVVDLGSVCVERTGVSTWNQVVTE